MALTDIKVKTAKPKDKPYKLADGGGMYLLINTNGSKYWRMKYRFAGKEKMLSIGVYPDVTLADAREKRSEARKLLAAGGDPGEAKKEEKIAQQMSLKIRSRLLLANGTSQKLIGGHYAIVMKSLIPLKKTFFPTLASALLPKSNQWSYWKHCVKWKTWSSGENAQGPPALW